MPAVSRLLTIFTVGTFSGGRRGQPEPDPGAWPDNGAGLGGNARQSNGGPGPGWEARPRHARAPFPQGGGFSGGPGGGEPGPYGAPGSPGPGYGGPGYGGAPPGGAPGGPAPGGGGAPPARRPHSAAPHT